MEVSEGGGRKEGRGVEVWKPEVEREERREEEDDDDDDDEEDDDEDEEDEEDEEEDAEDEDEDGSIQGIRQSTNFHNSRGPRARKDSEKKGSLAVSLEVQLYTGSNSVRERRGCPTRPLSEEESSRIVERRREPRTLC